MLRGRATGLALVVVSMACVRGFSLPPANVATRKLRLATAGLPRAHSRPNLPKCTESSSSDAAKVTQVEDLMANAKQLFITAYPKGPKAALNNVLSGFTVSLAMVPEAVAFAFVAGVSPIVGLQTTAILGFFAAAFGGRGGIME